MNKMKTRLLLIILTVFALKGIGCKKKDSDHGFNGKVLFNIKYGVNDQVASRGVTGYYNQFGSYIGSITPSVFIGKFLDMRLQKWTAGANTWDFNMNIIDNNTPIDSSNRIADFSNNATVRVYPRMDGPPNSEAISYNMFLFINLFYYQEFELPAQYDTVPELAALKFENDQIDLKGYNIGGTRTGRMVKGSSHPFLEPVYTWNGKVHQNFVFGETDSAFVFMGKSQLQTIDNPIGQEGPIMRSPHFDPIVINPVPDGSTSVVDGSMTFDTDGLIQIYAGRDNKPYTKDDVFVYAPKYWDRIKVVLK